MKKLIPCLCTVLFIFNSCKKETPQLTPHQPQYPANQFKATVFTPLGSAIYIDGSGDKTMYTCGYSILDRDSALSIGGGTVVIRIRNINEKGTYLFGSSPGPGQNVNCYYSTGDAWYANFLSSTTSGVTSPGSITIDSLKNRFISGTFTAQCDGEAGKIRIMNGSFKGNY